MLEMFVRVTALSLMYWSWHVASRRKPVLALCLGLGAWVTLAGFGLFDPRTEEAANQIAMLLFGLFCLGVPIFVYSATSGSTELVSVGMLNTSLSLFLLRKLPLSRLDFPRWQSVLAITLIGLLIGLDPSLRDTPPDMPVPPLWLAVGMGLLTTWVAFLIIVGVLRWWMRRGGRWDGQGDLFNLVAASWLVADALGAGLSALGVAPLFTFPLWLYSVWVGANALSGAIPKASLGYSIGGIVLGLIPAMLASMVVFAVLGIVLAMLGVVPLPPPGAGPAGMG